jgi:hypothetical protein
MPTKKVSPKSDRGNIKNIQQLANNLLGITPNLPATKFELRLKALYESAEQQKNQDIIDSLGFIIMAGPINNPVSILRHREYINSLKSKFGIESEEVNNLISFENIFSIWSDSLEKSYKYKQLKALNTILDGSCNFVKSAYYNDTVKISFRSFRRV